MPAIEVHPPDVAILKRLVVRDEGRLSLAAAEGLLALSFDQSDVGRMHELAAKARAGTVTDDEQAEIEAYSRVGSLIGILHSKARRIVQAKCSN